jgi:hypothetical protein
LTTEERHNPDFIASVASNILSEKFEEKIRLRKSNVFTTGGSIVVRCKVIDADFEFPASFMVKKVGEDEFGYEPDSSEVPNSAQWLFNDWAACEFLSDIPSEIQFSPKLYGGCREFGLIVLEDLGDGEEPNTSALARVTRHSSFARRSDE